MQTPPLFTPPWSPQGTVYGTLLNFRREWDLWAPKMAQDPYKAAPQAPVLYVKTANTFCPAGKGLLLQDGVTEVEIGATLGLVIGQQGQVAGAVLLNDWAVPHASYYRPPVKARCRDGYLALPEKMTAGPWSDWAALKIEVQLNGALVQTVDLGELKRDIPTLLADVAEFMQLQPGDVLMVGSDCLPDGSRPRARAGDRVDIVANGMSAVRTQVRSAA